jgi:pimeloyl-ACP methyl ester carboxylesterase
MKEPHPSIGQVTLCEIEGGRHLHCWEAGSGAPLLLIHAFPLNKQMWADVMTQLAQCHRVIAPDLRGFGQNPSEATGYRLVDLAVDLHRLLDRKIGDQAVSVVGVSMGGYIAHEFWESNARRVERLVLSATKATGDTAEARQSRLQMAIDVGEKGVRQVTEPMLERLLGTTTRIERPQVIDQVQQMMEQNPPSAIRWAQEAMAARADWWDRLPSIACPTLCLAGEEDRLIPSEVLERMAGRLPRGEFVSLPSTGHLGPIESPEMWSREVCRFLERAESDSESSEDRELSL